LSKRIVETRDDFPTDVDQARATLFAQKSYPSPVQKSAAKRACLISRKFADVHQ
jgi:hypothetical protein